VGEHVFVHDQRTVGRVLRLAELGRNASEIAREVGLPRSTVRDWLRGAVPRRRGRPSRVLRDDLPAEQYAYLLGLYLGDGHIARVGRTLQLRISLDSKYGGIIQSAATAVGAVVPQNSVVVVRHPRHNLVRVQSYCVSWPLLLPQHGAGPKHSRDIRLAPWQRAITRKHPKALVRGLIHSDGCRCIATIRCRGYTYRYPRYYFSNKSEDIKAIFCRHLDLLEIPWTRPNEWSIQMARREAVARLDEFVGPKR
jgi:hypothetical protein